MKNVINGLIKNSKKVEVLPSLGVIYVVNNEQLEEVFDYYTVEYIDFDNIPLKATTNYEEFLNWWIPYRIELEKSLYKNVEEY